MAFREALEAFSEEGQFERLRQMDSDACEALFDLLLMGALIDGELSAEEAELLAEEFLELPFYAVAHATEVRSEYGFARRGEMLERIHAGEVDAMLEHVAERLPDAAYRTAALRALAMVLESDGVDESEFSFAMQASRALDIPGVKAFEILRDAWEYGRPPFE